MNNQHKTLSNMYPIFTDVPSFSFWICLVPCVTHKMTSSCCTRPPPTSLKAAFYDMARWLIKTAMKLTRQVILLSFLIYNTSKTFIQPLHNALYFGVGWGAAGGYIPSDLLTVYANIAVFSLSLFLYRNNSFVHTTRATVPEGSEMIPNAARWYLPILIFGR